MLGWIEFGAVRRERFENDVIGDDKIIGSVPASTVKEHEHQLIAVSSRYFGEKYRHHFSVNSWQNESVEMAIMGAHSGKRIGVLAYDPSTNDGTKAHRRPTPPWIINPAKAGFILKHQPYTSAE